MNKFVVVSLALLGWAFYVASGGADFQPETRADATPGQNAPLTDSPSVTETVAQASTSALPEPVITAVTQPEEIVSASMVVTEEATPLRITDATAAQSAADTDDTAIIQASAVVLDATPNDTVTQSGAGDDMRQIIGDLVNMRDGPGTNHGVVTKLARGTKVFVLEEPGNDWLRIEVASTGEIGWMADWLVSAADS